MFWSLNSFFACAGVIVVSPSGALETSRASGPRNAFRNPDRPPPAPRRCRSAFHRYGPEVRRTTGASHCVPPKLCRSAVIETPTICVRVTMRAFGRVRRSPPLHVCTKQLVHLRAREARASPARHRIDAGAPGLNSGASRAARVPAKSSSTRNSVRASRATRRAIRERHVFGDRARSRHAPTATRRTRPLHADPRGAPTGRRCRAWRPAPGIRREGPLPAAFPSTAPIGCRVARARASGLERVASISVDRLLPCAGGIVEPASHEPGLDHGSPIARTKKGVPTAVRSGDDEGEAHVLAQSVAPRDARHASGDGPVG